MNYTLKEKRGSGHWGDSDRLFFFLLGVMNSRKKGRESHFGIKSSRPIKDSRPHFRRDVMNLHIWD